mmetsp:Transcript_15254/g.22491  ORF Transcript_15254/g.22491 Transcript_15254/m.22491 type:complete len:380 (-) Transcript_15254:116-1255(-)|eukprot:CAMPEP_0194214260 /NCGR_PEP_ID=MMETSP0156-20130528/15455_1 /TAXON_ID=33649 /ORGANISM="Thalassionema nitzschioides, Strain L26-B" /LENGTH=379 /DNA_ID=CAMNT_0038942489 /DNA_START=189 /DNA_END=1328 /DNA_ORIENTATION=+
MSPSNPNYEIGQLVDVEPRTWAGINRPGGVGRITKIDYSLGYAETVSVKYIVGGGSDTKIDLQFVRPHEEFLSRTSRTRRGREIYTASPSRKGRSTNSTTTKDQTTATKKKQNRKRHRKVSPSPGPPQDREIPEEPPTETKASTSKAKTTIQTSRVGGSNKNQSRIRSTKPPVPVICIDLAKVAVSPLSIPATLGGAPGPSGKASRNRELSSSEDQYEIVRTLPMLSGACLNQKQKKTDKTKYKKADKNCSKDDSVQRPALKSRARVPLKQVFENDMRDAKKFVKKVVGAVNKPPSSPAIVDNQKIAISTEEESRHKAFRQSLGQLFQKNDDMVSRAALLQHCTTSDSISFTKNQIEGYLNALCSQGRIMISDGDIYKI